jgi:hypothetical protein
LSIVLSLMTYFASSQWQAARVPDRAFCRL